MSKNHNYFDLINNPKHTFVIAEAGSNWKIGTYDEDFDQAKRLIEIASRCGADAVKFQTFRPETVFVPEAGKIDYLSEKGITETINDIFEKLSMPYEMIPKLADFCKKKNIMFMSTPFSINDAKIVDPYVSLHKVASFEINHVRLIEYLAKTQKPVLVSTGASSYEEIDFVVNLIKKNGNQKIGLLQCTSKYPAPIDALNLNVISNIKNKYKTAVGFSDHSMDPIIGPLVAIGLGATFIEKHFTSDRNLPGPDHPFALNPEELETMVKAIRKADSAKGTGDKIILEEEMELRLAGTRAIQAIKDIKKGDILQEGINFDVLRPGRRTRGLEPRFLEKIIRKKASKNISMGEGIIDYY